MTEEINLENWQNGYSNHMDSENHGSSFEVDARFDKAKKPELKSTVTFNIRNISDAIIKSIDIYKITICSPFNNIVDTAWFLYVFTFSKNKSHFIKISFYHNNSIFISRHDAAIFSLFLKLTTVSDVVFYEKIDLFAPPWDGYGEIKQISEEEIIN